MLPNRAKPANVGKVPNAMSAELPSTLPPNSAAAPLLDATSKVALACILFAWFFLDTLVVSVGGLQHGVRFFDMASVAADPARLFFPAASSLQRFAFSVVCLASLSLSALPAVRRERTAWFGLTAPLLLMLFCGLVLYAKTSGDFLNLPPRSDNVSQSVIHFANGLFKKGGGVIAKHIGIGVGGYVALAAAGLLAWRGVRNFSARAGVGADHPGEGAIERRCVLLPVW